MPAGPFSICSEVPPEGGKAVPVSSWAEGIEVWTVGCSDSWVRPKDWDKDPPVVGVFSREVVPLFSIMFPWIGLCFCRPHVVLGMALPDAFGGFVEYLNEEAFV